MSGRARLCTWPGGAQCTRVTSSKPLCRGRRQRLGQQQEHQQGRQGRTGASGRRRAPASARAPRDAAAHARPMPVPVLADEPEDTNDDFCHRCGGGGDLLLCDRCDRSYHMYCLDPPLEVAPEGEWACPAHKPGRSRGSKELAALGAPPEVDSSRPNLGGMRYRPPRVDHGQAKYQVAVPDLLAPSALKKARHAECAVCATSAAALWVPDKCAEEDVLELLGFSHRLAAAEFLSEQRFNEQVPTRLLCGPHPPPPMWLVPA